MNNQTINQTIEQMNDKDLKNLWQNSSEKNGVKFNKQQILADMNTQIHKIEGSIKKRNRIEVAASIFVIVFFSYQAYISKDLLGQLCNGAIVLAAVFIIYKLLEVQRSHQSVDVSTSIKEQLVNSKNYLKREQSLLQNIMYWYILPIIIPIAIMTLFRENTLWFKVVYMAVIVGVAYVIYGMNQKAAAKLDDSIEECNQAIKRIEE